MIVLPFPPSSNMAYPTGRNGRRFKSKRLTQWLKKCPEINESFEGERKIIYKMYFPDNRIRDGQSYIKAPLDYIVKQGVLKDDNRFIVRSEEWIDCGNDKENPRIEIYVEPFQNHELNVNPDE